MNQQQQMNMAAMGGPVGGPQMNAGTPSNSGDSVAHAGTIKRLNTAIYDYLLRNQLFDLAKGFQAKMDIDTRADGKSPNQRGQQVNGVDDNVDMDNRDLVIPNKPNDLPLPNIEADFMKDWWCQFWEIWNGHRKKPGVTQNTQAYINAQRAAMQNRAGMMNGNAAQNMRYNGMMPGVNNGVAMPNDLKRAAMQNQQRMTPQQQQMMKNMQANQQNGQMMQANQMERQGSQMDNVSVQRSGSPASGDAPSPKRQRIEGGMQTMNQGRPGQPGQMQGNQGIPPNMGPGGAQGSPMSQPGMDGATGEFYAAANGGTRMAMQPNAAVATTAGQPVNSNGNHALQDYQMQLMLLEQQNKKRLLMARQEQDSMSGGQHPAGVGPNGAFAQGMMDPNQVPPAMRAQIMAQNGQMIRPPSSHPNMMNPQQQAELMRQQGMQMPNSQFVNGQPQGMPGQPGQPLGTPRQNTNMPPPPAPQANAGGTGPSSPSQPPAPPTPSQTNKPKPGNKKDNAKKGGSNKKGANAAPATEAEAPPTPTPATPITPMNANSFNKNQNLPNGQAAPNNQANQQQNQQNSQAQPAAQPAPAANPTDMSGPFGALDGSDPGFGMPLEFSDLNSGDVLDNFDFDSFLNQDNDMGLGFDATFNFGDPIEAGGLDGTNG